MLCYIYILLQFLILVYVTFLVPRRRLNSQQTAVSYHKSIAVEKVHHNTTLSTVLISPKWQLVYEISCHLTI